MNMNMLAHTLTHRANNTTYLVFLSCRSFFAVHLPRLQHFAVFADAVVIILTYIYLYDISVDIRFQHIAATERTHYKCNV